MDYASLWTPRSRAIPIPSRMPVIPPSPYVPVVEPSPYIPPIYSPYVAAVEPEQMPFIPPEPPVIPPVIPSRFIPPEDGPVIPPVIPGNFFPQTTPTRPTNPQSFPTTPWTMPQTIPALPISANPEPTPIWPPEGDSLPNPNCLGYTPQPPVMLEPGTFPAKPWGTPVPIRLHPQLIYNPFNPLVPILQWDIIHRAEQARALTGRDLYIRPKLSEQATLPAAPKIWISSDHPYLATWMQQWGPIVVEKEKIAVRDVLDAIWEYFQQPLTEAELDRIGASPGGVQNLMKAAHQRAKDSYELRSVTQRNGFKRVDVLGGHRRFQGLRVVAYDDLTWSAYMGLLPGPVPRFT